MDRASDNLVDLSQCNGSRLLRGAHRTATFFLVLDAPADTFLGFLTAADLAAAGFAGADFAEADFAEGDLPDAVLDEPDFDDVDLDDAGAGFAASGLASDLGSASRRWT